jgi:hypothetical protein
MNLLSIRILLRNALLIVLTMIVIAGATGLSYKVHYCHDKLSGIAFYTELGIQKSATCGCKDDEKVLSSHSAGSSSILKKSSCCSNIAFFKKLTIVYTPTDFSTTTVNPPEVIAVFSGEILPVTSGTQNISTYNIGFRAPPLAGRKLVLFLSQQRLPAISYNS